MAPVKSSPYMTYMSRKATEGAEIDKFRGPEDHTNIRISYSGSKAQYKGDTRNHDL